MIKILDAWQIDIVKVKVEGSKGVQKTLALLALN